MPDTETRVEICTSRFCGGTTILVSATDREHDVPVGTATLVAAQPDLAISVARQLLAVLTDAPDTPCP